MRHVQIGYEIAETDYPDIRLGQLIRKLQENARTMRLSSRPMHAYINSMGLDPTINCEDKVVAIEHWDNLMENIDEIVTLIQES